MSTSRVAKMILAATLLLSFSWAMAQSSDNQSQSQQPSQDNSQQEKKDKKKKKDKGGAQDVLNSDVFSDAVAKGILDDIRDGLEGHSPRLMESAFDEDKMDGYLSFEDALEAMFQKYSEFRVHFNIAQTSTEGPKGILLVDIQLEEVPNVSFNQKANPQPQRREGQVRFELERGKKGWKIVDFSPRSFFS